MKNSLNARIAAVAASILVTVTAVDLMANYAYPMPADSALFAATTTPVSPSR